MSNTGNGPVNPQPNKIEEEVKDLRTKYSSLSKELEVLEKNNNNIEGLKQTIETIYTGFEQINKNVEDITEKLNKIAEGHEGSMVNEKKMKGIFRRFTVGVIGSIFSVVDKTMEVASNVRDGMEDIVAEAQYENKKKRMHLKGQE